MGVYTSTKCVFHSESPIEDLQLVTGVGASDACAVVELAVPMSDVTYGINVSASPGL